jgi:hypothetical protein
LKSLALTVNHSKSPGILRRCSAVAPFTAFNISAQDASRRQ